MATATRTITLPAIPIRDMVLFPGARVPFMVGRRASVRTLELGIKVGDHLVMLTQRDPKEEEPKAESFHALGTLALVESLIALPKDHYKVGVKGIARVRLERYLDEGDVVQAEVVILPEPAAPEAALLGPFHQAVDAFLARNPDMAGLISLDQIQEMPLGWAIDAVASALPVDVRDKQGKSVVDSALGKNGGNSRGGARIDVHQDTADLLIKLGAPASAAAGAPPLPAAPVNR